MVEVLAGTLLLLRDLFPLATWSVQGESTFFMTCSIWRPQPFQFFLLQVEQVYSLEIVDVGGVQ
jgi:hypothetical protein